MPSIFFIFLFLKLFYFSDSYKFNKFNSESNQTDQGMGKVESYLKMRWYKRADLDCHVEMMMWALIIFLSVLPIYPASPTLTGMYNSRGEIRTVRVLMGKAIFPHVEMRAPWSFFSVVLNSPGLSDCAMISLLSMVRLTNRVRMFSHPRE